MAMWQVSWGQGPDHSWQVFSCDKLSLKEKDEYIT